MSESLSCNTTATFSGYNYYPRPFKIKIRLDLEALQKNHYYDLIELPSGSHIPVPIAIRLLKKEKLVWKLLRLVTRRKKRTNNFYKCFICKNTSFFQYYNLLCDVCHWNINNGGGLFEPYATKYYEALRSKRISDSMKTPAFLQIIKNNQFWKLKYVESDRKRRIEESEFL